MAFLFMKAFMFFGEWDSAIDLVSVENIIRSEMDTFGGDFGVYFYMSLFHFWRQIFHGVGFLDIYLIHDF